jgi:sterol desaturase/sphingolipid hydroxylase (fatty acid hydroxylase superfamily)
MDLSTALLEAVWHVVASQGPWLIGLGLGFTILSTFSEHACNPGKVWWRNPDLVTDLLFCGFSAAIGRYLNIIAVLLLAAIVAGLTPTTVEEFVNQGAGPLTGAPLWLQVAVYVLGTDFLLYWSHRFFHGRALWAFHAVHHSPEQLDWTATFRSHPVNRLFSFVLVSAIMVKLGIPPWLMIALVPLDIIGAAWVHANLNWTLGPFKYVFASPVFHRWHHTGVDEGGESNFAPTFSFWDVLFGTFYMPQGKLPQTYGVDDPTFPKDFVGLLVSPFSRFFDEICLMIKERTGTKAEKPVQPPRESAERI